MNCLLGAKYLARKDQLILSHAGFFGSLWGHFVIMTNIFNKTAPFIFTNKYYYQQLKPLFGIKDILSTVNTGGSNGWIGSLEHFLDGQEDIQKGENTHKTFYRTIH